jgi:hypothetical protein
VDAQAEETGGGLTLTKTDDLDPVEVDGLLLYTIELTNDNAGQNQEFVVVDTLPDEVNFSLEAIDGDSSTGVCEENNSVITCSDIVLDDGDTETIQILVEPQEIGTITNFADVFEQGSGADECNLDADPDCSGADSIVNVDEDTRVVNDSNRDNRQNRRERIRDLLRDNPFLNNPNDFVDEDDDGISDVFDEDINDEDGDGDIDQDDEFLDAQNDLDNGEITDSEFTGADTFDDNGNGVSATADENGAEASTPGAVARSIGDPDEQAPLRSAPDNVVDEIPYLGAVAKYGRHAPVLLAPAPCWASDTGRVPGLQVDKEPGLKSAGKRARSCLSFL